MSATATHGAAAQLAASPRLLAQRRQLEAAFGPAIQRVEEDKSGPLQAKAAPGHPLAWVTQLVNMPADSVGSIDRVMLKIRKKKSTRELTGVELQDKILRIARKAGTEGGYRLGSYIYDESGDLTRKPGADDEEHGMPLLPKGFDLGDVDPLIKAFIYGTLSDAGQLQYIDENADKIFKTHWVIIDVDCQFDRRGRVGFHKDSRGTTAFVNLTFNNKKKMQGADNYEDLEGDPGLEEKLPGEVQKDIVKRRADYAGEKGIRSPELPAYGRISFSDPSLYHSTPLMGHRQKSRGDESRDELVARLKGYASDEELKTSPTDTLRQWYETYLDEYNRHGFEKLSKVSDKSYEKTYYAARKDRRLSLDLEQGTITPKDLKKQSKKPRTFIRTWVRFVPR